MLFFYLSAISLGLSVHGSYGCTLPSYLLNDVWQTSRYGPLTINGTAIGPIQVGSYGQFYFECYEQVGTKYIVRSTEVQSVLGTGQSFYLCFDLFYQSNDKYVYYLQTSPEAAASGQEVKIIQASLTPTSSQICDRTQADHLYDLFIRNGSEVSGRASCPSWLLGEFNYTSSSCADTFVSTCSDNAVIQTNTTLCATNIIGTGSSEVYCQYYITSGSVKYLTVSDSGSFFCIAAELNNTTVDLIFKSAVCPASDVPSSVKSAQLELTDTCYVPTTSTQSPTTSVEPAKSSARRPASGGLMLVFVLVATFGQSFY